MTIKGASKPLLILGVGTVALAGIGSYAWYESRRPAVLELYVFNTPGNPSVFIRTPSDRRILIDGGSGSDVVRRLTSVMPFYSRRIDIVIATKEDPKNVTGLIDVLDRYQVGRVIVPAVALESLGLASSSDPIYRVFEQTAASHDIKVEGISAGDILELDGESPNAATAVTAKVVFPVAVDGFKYSLASGPEMLLRVDYNSTSVIFVGTATPKVQKFIAASSGHADVLVFSHSVAPSSVAAELIASIAPKYLVYSELIPRSAKLSKEEAGLPKKKLSADPFLAGILKENRFNLQEADVVKITSDGVSLRVEKIK